MRYNETNSSNKFNIDTRWYKHVYKIAVSFVALESTSFLWYHQQCHTLYGDIDGSMSK